MAKRDGSPPTERAKPATFNRVLGIVISVLHASRSGWIDHGPTLAQIPDTAKHNDPACQVLVGQPISAGYGIDGLQAVCSDVLFLETPVRPLHFNQGVGRVYRDGQKTPPTVRIAIAEGTIQPRLHGRLLMQDELVNQVQGGWQDLREAIYGKV